jgi:hypothetical protein
MHKASLLKCVDRFVVDDVVEQKGWLCINAPLLLRPEKEVEDKAAKNSSLLGKKEIKKD